MPGFWDRRILMVLLLLETSTAQLTPEGCRFTNGKCAYTINLAHEGSCKTSGFTDKMQELEQKLAQHENWLNVTETILGTIMKQVIVKQENCASTGKINKSFQEECELIERKLVLKELESINKEIALTNQLSACQTALTASENQLNETKTNLHVAQHLANARLKENIKLSKQVEDFKKTMQQLHNKTEELKQNKTPKPGTNTSCKSIRQSCPECPSGVYNISIAGILPQTQVFCNMETDNGGWTLVYSYTFTNYKNFDNVNNAVTPHPSWPLENPAEHTPESTTIPLSETDYNAMNFSLWKHIVSNNSPYNEFLMKSNINDWIACKCLPLLSGSLTEWRQGPIDCRLIKSITSTKLDLPNMFVPKYHGFPGPVVLNAKQYKPTVVYYTWYDSSLTQQIPIHNSNSSLHGLAGFHNPHGNIYIR